MKRLLFAITFVVLIAAEYAEFAADLNIQVADQDLRPIENAKVEVTYQLNSIRGRVTTSPKYTDSNGMVSIRIVNTEYNTAKTDKNFVVVATYGGESNSVSYTVDTHPSVIVVQVPAYIVNVFVRDQNGRVLSAKVTARGVEKTTDASGRVFFHIPPGQTQIEANYNGVKKRMNLDVSSDTSWEFIYPLYSLTVNVVDEMGRPLGATVGIGSQYINTDAYGKAKFQNVPQDSPEVTVQYGNVEKTLNPYLPSEKEITVAFDNSPPQISDISAGYINGFVKLRAKIVDIGKYASGFGEGTQFYVTYRVDGNRRQTEMYPVGGFYYEADLQTLMKSAEIPYTIVAWDKEGNRNSVSGMYNLTVIVERNNPPIGRDESKEAEGSDGSKIFGFDTVMIAGGIVVLIVGIVGIYWYFKKVVEKGETP
ncbi:MAG: hypothetical protein QXW70_04015 [Candidatus Anstonellales archaeon]